MSALFGRKKGQEKTVLVIDIENGSVGAALARLSPTEAPKLFSQKRVSIPSLSTRDSGALSVRVDKAVRDVLQAMATVAARVRVHPTAAPAGEVSRIVFFLHAPWVMVGVTEPGKVSLDAQEEFLTALRGRVEESFDRIPVSFQSFGSRIPPVISSLFATGDDLLFINITGEVTELSKARAGSLLGYATIPLGTHTFVRTLGSHGGMTEPEARSALMLMRHKDADQHASWGEAFRAAGTHFMQESKDVLAQLLQENASPHGVYILGPEPMGEWLAQAITDDSYLSELFPAGSIARAIHPHHTKPFLSVHSQVPDVPLVLETLSIDARMSGI